MSPRQFKGKNETTAANANEPKQKKVWDLYLNTDVAKGGDKSTSTMLAAFQIKAGRSEKDQKPYVFLSGFSKELGGVNIAMTHKVDTLIEKLVDAGFDEAICSVLEKKGVLK